MMAAFTYILKACPSRKMVNVRKHREFKLLYGGNVGAAQGLQIDLKEILSLNTPTCTQCIFF